MLVQIVLFDGFDPLDGIAPDVAPHEVFHASGLEPLAHEPGPRATLAVEALIAHERRDTARGAAA